MSAERDLDNEMKRFALDDLTADRLLAGKLAPEDAPPGYQAIAQAVQTAAGTSPAIETTRDAATVAVVVEALRSSAKPPLRARRKSMLAQLLSAKVAAIAAVTVLGATAAAAATNTLPAPAQTAVSDAASHVGLAIPKPDSHANTHATDHPGRPANSAATAHATGPDATGNAKYGLCTAYAAGPSTTNPHSQRDNAVAFRNLATSAAAAGQSIGDYCKGATPPTHDGTTDTTDTTVAPGSQNQSNGPHTPGSKGQSSDHTSVPGSEPGTGGAHTPDTAGKSSEHTTAPASAPNGGDQITAPANAATAHMP